MPELTWLFEPFLWVKVVHILSATILFGTGLGTAFHMFATHLSGNPEAIAVAARNTVRADWLFTTPAVIVQPVSGLALAHLAGYPLDSGWLVLTYGLYLLAGACWIPVVLIQMRAARLAAAAVAAGTPLPARYFRLMRVWFLLGWPAFLALILVFGLMVFRPPGALF